MFGKGKNAARLNARFGAYGTKGQELVNDKSRLEFPLPPKTPVSTWNEKMPLEKQLIDYLNMPRNGNLNRYVVISGLRDEVMNTKDVR